MIPVFHQYDKISDNLLFFGGNVYLKMIVDLSNKNSLGAKVPSLNEYKVPSDKYTNTEYIISAKRKFKYYLVIEYPNPEPDSGIKTKSIPIYTYSILGLLDKMKEFDKTIEKAFAYKKDKLILLSDNVCSVQSYPSYNNVIEFTHDIYYRGIDHDIPDIGVKMILNNEYDIVFPANTTWKSFLYLIKTSDLYGWASSLVSGYMSNMTGQNVIDISSGEVSSYDRHKPSEVDKEVKTNTSIKRTKPITEKEKKRSFFDD